MNRINKRRNHCQFGDDPFAVTLHKSAEMSRKTLVKKNPRLAPAHLYIKPSWSFSPYRK